MAFQSNVMRTDLSSTAKVVESAAASYDAVKTTARSADATLEAEQFLASDSFCKIMESMISQDDIKMLLEKQKEAITKFEKTNETFGRFNDLSAARFVMLSHQFASHTKMLLEMKKDLDSVFRRIRTLKTKLMKQYGHAFYATSASIKKLEEELGASIESETAAGETSLLTANKGLNAGHESSVPEPTHEVTEKEHSNHKTESCENEEETNPTDPVSDGAESMSKSSDCPVYKTSTLDSADSSKFEASCNVNSKEEVAVSGASADQDAKNEEHLDNIKSTESGCHQQMGNSWKYVARLKPENNSSDCLKEEENIGNTEIVDNSVD